MKKAKRLIVTVALALALVVCLTVLGACGGTKLDAGTYQGTYKCNYTKDGKDAHVGCAAKFEVDEDNLIWNIELSAVAADWTGAEADAKYSTPSLGQRPWDAGKILGQFSGAWTVDEFMSIKVTVDENGVPKGDKCIESKREVTVGVGFELGTAVAILAVQNGIETANKI